MSVEPTISFQCPRCARVTRVPASFAGKQGKCPGCRATIEVPDPSQAPLIKAPSDVSSVESGVSEGAPAALDAGSAPTVAALAPPDPTLVRAMGADQRPCAACGQPIRQAAVKCRHCGHLDDKPCPLCGETIKATARKCRHCGEFLDAELREQRRHGLASDLVLASPGARLAAYLLDEWALNLPTIVGLVVMIVFLGRKDDFAAGMGGIVAAGWFWGLTFVQWYRVTTTGQTIAKRWLKLKVVRLDGGPCGFLQGVVLRNWIYSMIGCPIFSWIAALIRILDGLMIFGSERRCLRDYLASTRVVETSSDGSVRRLG